MTWHSMHEGPILKRLRIRFFGLNPQEKRDNLESFADMQAKIRMEIAEEDRLFDEFCAKWPEEMTKDWREWMPKFYQYQRESWSLSPMSPINSSAGPYGGGSYSPNTR